MGNALVVEKILGGEMKQDWIAKLLHRLHEKKYIKSFSEKGKKGYYAILVNNYEPTGGAYEGMRLNATATTDYSKPVYRQADDRPMTDRRLTDDLVNNYEPTGGAYEGMRLNATATTDYSKPVIGQADDRPMTDRRLTDDRPMTDRRLTDDREPTGGAYEGMRLNATATTDYNKPVIGQADDRPMTRRRLTDDRPMTRRRLTDDRPCALRSKEVKDVENVENLEEIEGKIPPSAEQTGQPEQTDFQILIPEIIRLFNKHTSNPVEKSVVDQFIRSQSDPLQALLILDWFFRVNDRGELYLNGYPKVPHKTLNIVNWSDVEKIFSAMVCNYQKYGPSGKTVGSAFQVEEDI